MLLAEHLALIALEPAGGLARPGCAAALSRPLISAALLTELAVQTRLGQRGGRVIVLDDLPSRHLLLTETLHAIRRVDGRLDCHQAIRYIGRQVRGLPWEVLEGLVRRDVLHACERRWRVFGERHYRVRSLQAQNEALEALHEAAVGRRNSLEAVAMLALALGSGLVRALLTTAEHAEADARMQLLLSEIGQELASNAELLDTHYSIALMTGIGTAVGALLKEEAS
jgi:adenylate kinase